MTRPITPTKVLLVKRSATDDDGAVPVRRYRLARLRLEHRSDAPASRFEQVKRVYD